MVSSKDIAKRAGVSQTTVSRVLNNAANVHPSTREKVMLAIRELNYYPNLVARSLVTQSSRTIALISGTLKNDFFVEATDAIVNYAMRKGYQTLVIFEEDGLEDVVRSVLGNQIRGLLLSSIRLDDPLHAAIEHADTPYCYFNRRPRQGGHYVVLDNVRAASMVTNHLIGLGHRRIAYLGGVADVSTFYERQQGFTETMAAHGLTVDPDLVCIIDHRRTEQIDEAARKLLQRPAAPTAVFCATDMIALQLMDAMLQFGVNIPEDVSIAGIDNTRMSSHSAIQMTTAGHPRYNIGELAVEQLLNWIENGTPERERQIVLHPELFVRRTTAPPKRS